MIIEQIAKSMYMVSCNATEENWHFQPDYVKENWREEARVSITIPIKRQCKECGGTKTTTAYYAELVTGARIQENCPTCKGTGEEESTPGKIVEEWIG